MTTVVIVLVALGAYIVFGAGLCIWMDWKDQRDFDRWAGRR